MAHNNRSMLSERIMALRENEQLAILGSHLLVALMMGCAGIAAMQFMERFFESSHFGYFPWVCMAISFEAMYSQRKLRRTSIFQTNAVIYRLTELVIIVVVLKASEYLATGTARLFSDVRQWGTDFFSNFFHIEFVFILIIAGLIWWVSLSFAGDLAELEGDEVLFQVTSLEGLQSDRGSVHRSLANRVYGVGIAILFITALTRVDIRIFWGERLLSKSTIVHVMAYFILSLLLLSLTHLARQRATWAWERVSIHKKVTKWWLIYSLIFLLVIAVVAFLLPTSYTTGLFPTIKFVILFLIQLLYALVLLILTPFLYLYSWLLSLFNTESPVEPPEMLERVTFPEPPTPANAIYPAWFEIFKSILFWGLFLGIIGIAFYLYISQNRELMEKLRRMPVFKWLASVWDWIVVRVRSGAERLPEVLRSGVKWVRSLAPVVRVQEYWRFINPRMLSPRQRIQFFYLVFLRRAGEVGLGREKYQTPYEYSEDVSVDLPPAQEEIDDLTKAFVEARYSQHDFTEDKALIAAQEWQKIRKAIQEKKKEG